MYIKGPGAVPHNCNPSYLEGRDWEDCGTRLAQAKKLARPHLNQQTEFGGPHL
jgi:hypothetical protein